LQVLFNTVLFTGNAESGTGAGDRHPPRCRAGQGLVSRFSDGEVTVEIRQNVRARDVFVVQPTARRRTRT